MTTRRAAWCAGLIAVWALGAALCSAGPAGVIARPAQTGGLAGQLLVALPELEDPRFTHTVIYMVSHDPRGGAMGLILNRPLGDVPMAVLLRQAGLPSQNAKGSVKLHVGGPVEPTRITCLHSDDYQGPDTMTIAGGIAVTAQPEILQAIAAGKGPRRARFMVGYAGWAPGQLEAEMKAGYWVAVPSDEAILFDDAYETKWDRAMTKRKISL